MMARSTQVHGFSRAIPERFFCLFVWGFGVFFVLGGGFCLELHLQHMEVLRLRVEWELPLRAYTTATAMQDPSHICELPSSS